MSSISIETNNESRLRVEEYVRYIRIKDQVQQVLDTEETRGMLRDAEESINGLTIDIVIKFSVNK
ncbi:MAG: hypothetical protein OIN88_05590 [Candidatus Methanoperedens sp.]|nr:hypothetical protein [Candidatus Methanoperedens sp.]MCZ7359840.1 hypothetical protein [Candidatus Methanoperedens sp.]HLB71995.1 hypothetical protein [Candidatus Methanoperedens sp.]